MSRPRWACLARRRTSGGDAGWLKAKPVSRIGRVDRIGVRIRRRLRVERADRAVAAATQAGAGTDREHRRAAGVDGASRVVSSRSEPAGVDGPADRSGDPPDPHRPARRARPRRRQETGADPTRWWLAAPRPRATSITAQDRVGYDYIHSAIDAHSRLAYSEDARRTRRARPAPRSGNEHNSSSLTMRSPSKRSSPTTPRTTSGRTSPPRSDERGRNAAHRRDRWRNPPMRRRVEVLRSFAL